MRHQWMRIHGTNTSFNSANSARMATKAGALALNRFGDYNVNVSELMIQAFPDRFPPEILTEVEWRDGSDGRTLDRR